MTVRGIGVRVIVAVVVSIKCVGRKSSTATDGGMSETEHSEVDDYAHTMGFVVPAPEGETEPQTKSKSKQ